MDKTEITDRMNEDADTVNFTNREVIEVPVKNDVYKPQTDYKWMQTAAVVSMAILAGMLAGTVHYYLTKSKREQTYLPVKNKQDVFNE